jgi:hypothetical protein
MTIWICAPLIDWSSMFLFQSSSLSSMVKNKGLELGEIWIWIPVQILISFITVDKLFHFSLPQFQ